MNTLIKLLIVLLTLLESSRLLAAPTVYKPSFDCNKARQFQEIAICNSRTISELDGTLGKKYLELLKKANPEERKNLQYGQKMWVETRTEVCKVPQKSSRTTFEYSQEKCLERSYTHRIGVLDLLNEDGLEWPPCHPADHQLSALFEKRFLEIKELFIRNDEQEIVAFLSKEHVSARISLGEFVGMGNKELVQRHYKNAFTPTVIESIQSAKIDSQNPHKFGIMVGVLWLDVTGMVVNTSSSYDDFANPNLQKIKARDPDLVSRLRAMRKQYIESNNQFCDQANHATVGVDRYRLCALNCYKRGSYGFEKIVKGVSDLDLHFEGSMTKEPHLKRMLQYFGDSANSICALPQLLWRNYVDDKEKCKERFIKSLTSEYFHESPEGGDMCSDFGFDNL